MYLNVYKIEGTINLDNNPCFSSEGTYPNFQKELDVFKLDLISMVNHKDNKSFLKFGDGDYYFLKSEPVGSATPGRRALGRGYDQIDMQSFINGSKLNDFYICEIYPENRKMFCELFPGQTINFPAEYVYGLVANKWFFKTFKGKIGLIGADKKIDLIRGLMEFDEYRKYLGIDSFNDYIKIPQKFACDDIDATERVVAEQLKASSSDIFLLGVGHTKSALTHRLKKHKSAVYLDVGSGIDAIAGIIDIERPFFGDWTNYQSASLDYNEIDYLQYKGKGKHILL